MTLRADFFGEIIDNLGPRGDIDRRWIWGGFLLVFSIVKMSFLERKIAKKLADNLTRPIFAVR